MSAALLGVELVALAVSLLLMRAAESTRQRRSLVAYQLKFPRGLEPEGVEAFLGGLSGLLLPWWKRWLASPYVSLEVHASSSGISHFLLAPAGWASAVEGTLQASLPSVRYESVDLPFAVLTIGAEYKLSDHRRSVRMESSSMNAKLLRPASTQQQGQFQLLDPNLLQSAEAVSALKEKQSHPLLLTVPRIGVASDDVRRARRLLRDVETAWHESRAPGVHLGRRTASEAAVAKRMIERRAPLVSWPATFNSQELSGLIRWPIEAVAVPGLALGGCRLVAASPAIPRTGTAIGDSNFPGDPRPLALDTQARLRHVQVLGPTGTGKSTLLVNMAVQDLEAGRGVVLLDPKGDLVQSVLERMPPKRRADVIVLDPADTSRPVGLNPLESVDVDHAEVVVENLVGLFKSLYRHSWGPRLDDILRAALLTLATSKGTTLCEVPLILTDPGYRRRLVGGLDDPVGLESFWGWYEALSDPERAMAVGPVLNKVRAFIMRPRVRNIIGQSQPKLNLRDVLEDGKVLLVSLASGLLGDEAAALLGALVVAELWNATQGRAAQHSDNRRPVMAYLDEWQNFLHLPTPMASVLAEARGLGLGMVLAHQHLGQLPAEAQHAVLANARSKVVFQLPAGDARLIARELGGVLTADDLQGLGAYEVAAQLFAAGTTQPVATARTRPMGEATGSADDVRASSREQYGVARGEVEKQLRSRQHARVDAPTGRRQRHGGGS
ncbi:MAG: type IV secretory system conjugative DNA transfer family protein [Acidimicrobiales bacterium]